MEKIITRDLHAILEEYVLFPVIAILGPRQSGKTILAREAFPNHRYVNLELPADLAYVMNDPKGFFREYENAQGIIIDEFQRAPEILSYIQVISDEQKRPGYFVLTGSQNFLMNSAITQSLAGRIGIVNLFPLSIHELSMANLLPDTALQLIVQGGYPRIWNTGLSPEFFYPSYIQTYVERDVRSLTNVGNISTFQKFIALCAGRIGQLLNVSELAAVCGISRPTAHNWLSILEATYILFQLQPYHTNFNKRLTKSPKLYFHDTGLACSLLGINTAQDLMNSPFRGPLFENLIIADLYKQFAHSGHRPSLYFWRDSSGSLEIDCLIEIRAFTTVVPIEIKAGETIVSNFFTNITKWSEQAQVAIPERYIVYGGHQAQQRTAGRVVGWQEAGNIIKHLLAPSQSN